MVKKEMVQIIQFEYEDLMTAVRNCLKEAIFDIKSLSSPAEIEDKVLFPEACKITGLSESAMRKLCMEKKVPFMKYGTRRLVFSRRELKKWMKERTISAIDTQSLITGQIQKSAIKKI